MSKKGGWEALISAESAVAFHPMRGGSSCHTGHTPCPPVRRTTRPPPPLGCCSSWGVEEARGTLSPLRCGAHARPLTLASPADRATPSWRASESGADQGFCQRQLLLRASRGAGNFPPPLAVWRV